MESGSSKRRRGVGFVTPTACKECRLKKAKCDGQTPCGRCVAQGVADCVYEVPVRKSKGEMRSELDQLRDYQQHSARIFEALASGNDSADILDQLRNGEGLENIARRLEGLELASIADMSLYDGIHTTTNSTTNSTPNMTNRSSAHDSPYVNEDWHERVPTQARIEEARYHGQEMIMGDESYTEDPLSHHGRKFNNESWTNVTSDGGLVEHLLALYFCWEYPIFATVSKEHFLEDFRAGVPRYCSSLLVNALLALACRFSDRPRTECDYRGYKTPGDAFYAEAWRLFNEQQDHYVLTTVQALGVMSIRESSCGRIKESSFLAEQSIRLAVEMGLHHDLQDNKPHDTEEGPVRETTFWGAFSLNEMLCLCTGALPHLSQHISLPTKPSIIAQVEEALWIPYTDDGAPLGQRSGQPSNLRSVYKTFCELSERVHTTLYTMYNPSAEVSSRALIALYNQYIEWYDTIPVSLRRGQNFTPAVLFAHLFYHSATLLLFQPFMNLKLATSAVLPREVCRQAADAINSIVRSYSELYTLRRTPSFVPYFVLTSAVIHLATVKTDPYNQEAKNKLVQGMSDLHEMAECHGFAVRAIDSLLFLAKRWGVNAFEGQSSANPTYPNRPSPSHLDPLSLDVSALDKLQKLEPTLFSTEVTLFSPFPLQGLLLAVLSGEPEKEGFATMSPQEFGLEKRDTNLR